MYSYIKGILKETGTGSVVVEAGGIGYDIAMSLSSLMSLPPMETEVKIYTHFSVKEDEQTLYGFLTQQEREMFRLLIGVSGIGPKGALAILGTLKPADVCMAVATGDSKAFSAAPGIGKKTAERIILELKDKLAGKNSVFNGPETAGTSAPVTLTGKNALAVSEAIEALTMLGYSRSEAGRAIGSLTLSETATTEEVLKAALKTIRS